MFKCFNTGLNVQIFIERESGDRPGISQLSRLLRRECLGPQVGRLPSVCAPCNQIKRLFVQKAALHIPHDIVAKYLLMTVLYLTWCEASVESGVRLERELPLFQQPFDEAYGLRPLFNVLDGQ
jgi:hypothetical protein